MAVDLRGQKLWAGEYEIRERVAEGGMATVFTAYARSLETAVAIKVLSPRLAGDPAFLARFHAEATSIAALHHPNIIEVHHFGVEDGNAYIAMRYVASGTLKERLQGAAGPMDLSSAARLIAQVAAALQYAHERGLVHLDVKPANVLLGSADWPLLSDFGIVRMAGDARPDGHRIAGTPAYMSPEQWQGLEVDGRSDQYSLALTFYELVTGRRAFSGETSAELKAKHLGEEPPRPRELNPGIPGPVEDVILRGLAKRPEDRFDTVGGFGTALVEAVERSRGMQLETKQAIVSAAPNLVALVVLSVVAPILAGLPDPRLPVFRDLTLDWPVALLLALLQSALLMGVRWQLVGLMTRLLATAVDALDRITRLYVRVGTDPEGPLRVKAWRSAVVGSAEGIVNVAYLFVLYQFVGTPLIKTVALSTSSRWESWISTAVAALVLLIAAGIVLRIARASGPILAVCALAVCWGFVSAMPLVDQMVLDGRVSLQWLAKLVVGLAVLAAFLGVRRRAQRGARQMIVPALAHQLGSIRGDVSEEERAATRRGLESGVDGLVDVAYLVIGFPIIALPLGKVLEEFVGEIPSSILLTLAVVVVAGLLVNGLRARSGVIAASLGLLLCTPTLLGLPLFVDEGLLGGTSLQWMARLIVGLGVVAILLGIRRRLQITARGLIVPVLDHQLGSLVGSDSEAQAGARLSALERASDGLVDALYLLAGYLAVVGPVAAALSDGLDWLSLVVYGLFVLVVAWVIYKVVRGVAGALRPAALPPRGAVPMREVAPSG